MTSSRFSTVARQIADDLRANPGGPFRAIAGAAILDPWVAVALHRVSHALYGTRFSVLSWVIKAISGVLWGLDIHPGAVIGRNLRIAHTHGVVIGGGVVIGDDVEIYGGVVIGHKGEWQFPIVGNSVILYTRSTILGSVFVGDGARVGAHSLVVRDVDNGVTVVGAPARPTAGSAPSDVPVR